MDSLPDTPQSRPAFCRLPTVHTTDRGGEFLWQGFGVFEFERSVSSITPKIHPDISGWHSHRGCGEDAGRYQFRSRRSQMNLMPELNNLNKRSTL